MTFFGTSSRGRRTAVIVLGVLCAIAVPAGSASAGSKKATTLHLFAKTTENTFTDPSGHPILGHVPPPPAGSVLTNTGLEYRGTAKHHALISSASTNIICFVTKAPSALCYGQVAIGGSMLLANRVVVNLALANPFASIPINAGTGRFAGAHGTIQTATVGSGTSVNMTITYTT